MSRKSKHAVICEVCPDRVGHQGHIVVGRKQTGMVRVIHDRARCRQKWERDKERIMAKWPENKPATSHALPSYFTVSGTSTPPPKPVTLIKKLDPPPPVEPAAPPAAIVKEEAVQPTTKPKVTRHHWKPKPQLIEFIDQWLKEKGYTSRVTARQMIAVLQFSHPGLCVDLTGTQYTDQAIAELIRSRSLVPIITAESPRLTELEGFCDELRRRNAAMAEAETLAQTIVAGVLQLMLAGEVATLQTLHELMRSK